MSIVKLQSAAIINLEKILTDSGYISWDKIRPTTNSEADIKKVIKEQTKPIFYYATSSPYAPTAVIKKKGSKPNNASLFLLYGLTSPRYKKADNITQAIAQSFSVTLQYNTPQLFKDTPDNEFAALLSDLLENLENDDWAVNEIIAEQPFEATEGTNIFNYRKQYSVEKLF